MVTGLACKLALATVGAVGLAVSGVPIPTPLGSCLRTVGVASAAPSPTCGGDERECLRLSAKTGLYGVRYVTPEDVARCVEAFNACIHGTLNGGGNPVPPTSTSPTGGKGTGLPQRFGITQDAHTSDCSVSGDAVTCTTTWDPLPEGFDSWTGSVTGTLSGLTMTGTQKIHIKSHSLQDPSCLGDEDYSGPVKYVFSPDGTVTMRVGPNQRLTTSSGSCSGSNSGMTEGGEVTGTWSKIE